MSLLATVYHGIVYTEYRHRRPRPNIQRRQGSGDPAATEILHIKVRNNTVYLGRYDEWCKACVVQDGAWLSEIMYL